MLTVISPAKRLNEATQALMGNLAPSTPEFSADAAKLAKIARGLTAEQLCRLMDISPTLGQLNHDRFRAFGKTAESHVAAYLFDGDTYAGLEARRMDPDTLRWAQGHLRILSGLYGLLRPLDMIQPYRLEMGSRMANTKGVDLYAFWADKLAKALNALAAEQGAKTLVNCASTEYFSAVTLKSLKMPVVTPVFLEERGGDAKIVSFWAKKARGAMARYISEHHLTDPDDLRGFATGGYRFNAEQSAEGRLIFTRPALDLKAA